MRVLDRGYGGLGQNCTRCPVNANCVVGASVPVAQNGTGKKNEDGSWGVMSCTPESAC